MSAAIDRDEARVLVFERHRGLLNGMAYRMLGAVGDAEDMVQEAWLRLARVELDDIQSPRAWLVKTLSRLCLDRLKSARVQREQYYGTWLPEPLLAAGTDHKMAGVDESVSIALLLVLEKLSPMERAGFLLHEVFGHTFEEVAAILGRPVVNCRKMVSRARARVRAEKPRFSASVGEHEELLRRFLEACRMGELEPLLELLSESVALHSDGGGKAIAVPKVLDDRVRVARFFINITRQRMALGDEVDTRFSTFNGAPGLLIREKGKLVTALSLQVRDGRIERIYSHRNPDKLAKLERHLEVNP